MVTALRTTRRLTHAPGLDHPIGWFTPQPLWRALSKERLRAQRGRPEILRFATDGFMDELIGLLASDPPGDLAALVAQPESWREPGVGLAPDGSDRVNGTLRLYQPSQQRFYLVAGALGCKVPGVPDREIDGGQGESAFFVLRRLNDGQEYGWSSKEPSAGANGHAAHRGAPCQPSNGKGWTALQLPDHQLLCDEERLPLFPLTFRQDGVRRRLLAGLVPTASGETFRASAALTPFPSGADLSEPGADPRPALFQQTVTGVLQSFKTWLDGLPSGGPSAADQRIVDRAGTMLMLDLMAALRDHVPALFNAIMASNLGTVTGGASKRTLIQNTVAGGKNLRDVLKLVEQQRTTLEALESDDDLSASLVFSWATTSILNTWLANTTGTISVPRPNGTPRTETVTGSVVQVRYQKALSQPFSPPAPATGVNNPLAGAPPEIPKLDPRGTDLYVLRLVYDRPKCRCVTISEPTRPFALATFFDPDAPARPIRIQMPIDTSPEGLRKFDKGVAFMLSDQLRKQMARVSGLQELMDGEAGPEPELSLGLLCSFSIPIITICALILLLIIVSLLNIIFWWLPFFKLCLPIRLSVRG